jgi:thiosulfate dehydrogenase [quinone] large subunit
VNKKPRCRFSAAQQTALIALRTVIGWHFLYEGYYKLALPGWSRDGAPLPRWTSAAYFKVAPGPLGRLFQRLVEAGWVGWIDNAVKISLLVIGLSLILGIFTRTGCAGAISLLTLFYLTSMPLSGIQQPVSEGAYLLVNKTLVEDIAVWVLLVFGTGEIAGLDLLLKTRRRKPDLIEAPADEVETLGVQVEAPAVEVTTLNRGHSPS